VRPSAIIEVHGYAKQSSGYGYSGVRDLNAPLATMTTQQAAPVVVAQRLRGGCVWVAARRGTPGRRRVGDREETVPRPIRDLSVNVGIEATLRYLNAPASDAFRT
jgi:hypothetical protein